MPSEELVISRFQDVVVVNFRNSAILDSTVVESIGKELYPLVDAQAQRKIILDFCEVRFFSSSMISVLISMHQKSQAIKGKVVICGLRADLKKVFTTAKLDKLLNFAPNETEALRQFNVYLEA
ncbi:MAG: STAS domain-containing protein [Phycisphaerae bacterium]|jgi:anti-sigma B factor antagonist|nr:STAS domain-containing protein [Phycisphaerae bacterium]